MKHVNLFRWAKSYLSRKSKKQNRFRKDTLIKYARLHVSMVNRVHINHSLDLSFAKDI